MKFYLAETQWFTFARGFWEYQQHVFIQDSGCSNDKQHILVQDIGYSRSRVEPSAYPGSGHWLRFKRSIFRYLEIKQTLPAASLHQYLDLRSHYSLNNRYEKNTCWYFTNMHLLPDANVPLLDEDTSVVNRLGKSKLENLQYSPSAKFQQSFNSFIWLP